MCTTSPSDAADSSDAELAGFDGGLCPISPHFRFFLIQGHKFGINAHQIPLVGELMEAKRGEM